jgi:hypothetical protein
MDPVGTFQLKIWPALDGAYASRTGLTHTPACWLLKESL